MIEKTPITDLMFVGLDLSLTGSGFCLKRGTEIQLKTIKTKPADFENDLERLRHIRKTILDLIPVGTVMVCVEDFFIPGRASQINAAKGLIMLGTLIRVAMYEQGMPFYVISPPQLKKYATGKGNGPKGIVIREIYKRWGIDAKDDNQADACVLAHIAEALYKHPNFQLHKYQEETVAKILADRPCYNL